MDKAALIQRIRHEVGEVISHWSGAHQAWAYLQLHGWGYRQNQAYDNFLESVDRQMQEEDARIARAAEGLVGGK